MVSTINKFIKSQNSIVKIAFVGLLLRLLFTYVLAPFYFNRDNIYLDNDTTAWMTGLYNLIFNGEFTVMLNNEMAAYCRMPGYSLFLAPAFGIVYFFHFIQGVEINNYSEMWYSVLKLTAFFQIICDTCNIYFIHKICHKIFPNHSVALIAGLLYAFYPFVIVWNPVCYSEVPSLFFALMAISIALSSEKKHYLAFAGASLGFAVLNRPQFALLAPLMIILFYQKYALNLKQNLIKGILFLTFFTITYGAWPLRNYLRFNKIIITQDLRGFDNWNDDVIAFMQYIYSVKAEWQPQFSDILQNKTVVFPKESYLNHDDSLKLERAVYLAKNCGRGFSEWAGYWKQTIPIFDTANDCSAEVAGLFNELRIHQMQQNPFNYYVKVPLKNLQKAIFKSGLTDNNSVSRKIGGYLFYYRTLLIFIGIIGLFLIFREKKIRSMALFVGLFFGMLYFYLCFGTSPQCRNIEIRYFLQADVLMLIPAAYLISKINFINKFINGLFPTNHS
jgi:hypothetical protein